MKTDNTVRYYNYIPGLWVPNTAKYDQTDSDINEFIDTVPQLTETIENTFAEVMFKEVLFTDAMDKMLTLLEKVYASGLESDAKRIRDSAIDDSKIAVARKMLKPFITEILSLSVRMQKAQNSGKSGAGRNVSKIELHAEMARNILTVCNYFADGEFEKANVMIKGLSEHDSEEPAYFKLINLITAKKYTEAIKTINELREKHIEAIANLAGSDFTKIVLTVDDMPEMLSFVNNALKNNYKIIAVPSAKAALNVIKTQKPDLFLLDIDMPEMDGFELAGIIRSNEEFEKTPLVFLTGNSTRDHITVAMALNCNDFIVKPTTYEYLLTIVGKYLG